MSTSLWKYYLEDDLLNFRQLLATASYSTSSSKASGASNTAGALTGSPGGGVATSPNVKSKGKGLAGWNFGGKGGRASHSVTLTRADINSQDEHGVTLLHHMASSSADNAREFASALLEVPTVDLYIQDLESGWTALHRALYNGNVTIAYRLMRRDIQDVERSGGIPNTGGLIKIKDHEGNSPFEVFGTTVISRTLQHNSHLPHLSGLLRSGTSDASSEGNDPESEEQSPRSRSSDEDVANLNGDELYTFGSNKNLNLGFGDEDDRQYPERITLKRPERLVSFLNAEYRSKLHSHTSRPGNIMEEDGSSKDGVPDMVQYKAIKIQDVQLAKFHTAVLTTDPEANLYICGFGPGGRLGTGDALTRFNFTCILGGGLHHKKIVSVGLGQDHTLAVSEDGEVYSWGSNAFGQLGYGVNASSKDDEPAQLYPRQIFGALKRESAIGCAASKTHSVVFSHTSLYTFGKNDGQLGLVDADAGLLPAQPTPRKVAASLFPSLITMVSAIDKATICLLANHDVWVFANFGYTKVIFPLDSIPHLLFNDSFFGSRRGWASNYIVKICSGGDTICAQSREGEVFTMNLKVEPAPASSSTTNPAKIKGALSSPQRVWSLRKDHMAVHDVDVGQDGSIIICTESGSVWKKVKRAKIKDTSNSGGSRKDYKFSRVPSLTRVTAVRSNTFGAFAAVRKDSDVLRSQMHVAPSNLWSDVFRLLPFRQWPTSSESSIEERMTRDSSRQAISYDLAGIRRAIITSTVLEDDLSRLLSYSSERDKAAYDITVGTFNTSIRIPCNEFILVARSSVLKNGFQQFRQEYFYTVPNVFTIEYDKNGRPAVIFQNSDILVLLNIILYIYTDGIIDVWNHVRNKPKLAMRYRQVRAELIRTAAQLDMKKLEHAVRVMAEPVKSLNLDLDQAISDVTFFETADVEVQLDGSSVNVHSAMMSQRCPFFEGLFHGRADGGWLTSRREKALEVSNMVEVDLRHIDASTFRLVLRYLYADCGEEIFEDTKSADLDTFLDTILNVLSAANELMLDRLAQVCQKTVGSFGKIILQSVRRRCSLFQSISETSANS